MTGDEIRSEIDDMLLTVRIATGTLERERSSYLAGRLASLNARLKKEAIDPASIVAPGTLNMGRRFLVELRSTGAEALQKHRDHPYSAGDKVEMNLGDLFVIFGPKFDYRFPPPIQPELILLPA